MWKDERPKGGAVEGRTRRDICRGKSRPSLLVMIVTWRIMKAYLLLPNVPLICLFLDFLLLRIKPTQARFLQSLLVRVGATAGGSDTSDGIIGNLNTISTSRWGRKILHGGLATVKAGEINTGRWKRDGGVTGKDGW